MRTFFELSGFVAIALVAHIAVWSPRQTAGLEGAGAQGDAILSIKASTASVATMVETWDTPPDLDVVTDVVMTEPELAELTPPDIQTFEADPVARPDASALETLADPHSPDTPEYQKRAPEKLTRSPEMSAGLALPDMAVAPSAPALPSNRSVTPNKPALSMAPPPEAQPQVSVDPPPRSKVKKKPKLKPKPKQKAKPKPKTTSKQAKRKQTAPKKASKSQKKKSTKSSIGSSGRVAKGTGGGVAKGNNKKSRAATVSKSQKRSLLAKWGGQIRARIARRAPRGVGRGTAVVTITVSGSGSLLGVRLSKSSGNAKLDKLALAAVRNAGRFPAAPKKLGIRKHTFRLPVKAR
ncbi:MAG: hypothetical protein CSA70_05320 [Rhodobacterales bacterium]|nr:MAG: hypothetical protein CSA70_05320 [Rhodobacterales bacterium]